MILPRRKYTRRGPDLDRPGARRGLLTDDMAFALGQDVPAALDPSALPGLQRARNAVQWLGEEHGIKPWEHQMTGATWLASRGWSLLGDAMRVGKTCSLLLGATLRDFSQLLVVCPSLARLVWAKWARMVLGPNANILLMYGRGGKDRGKGWLYGDESHGKRNWIYANPTRRQPMTLEEAVEAAHVIVVTSDLLSPQMARTKAGRQLERDDFPGAGPFLYEHAHFDAAVGDEIHKWGRKWEGWVHGLPQAQQSPRAKVNRRTWVRRLTDGVDWCVMASGTMTTGYMRDYWSPLDIASGGMWGDKPFGFEAAYCGGHKADKDAGIKGTITYWRNDGESNVAEFEKRKELFMLTRRKEDVFENLPPKIRHVQVVDHNGDAKKLAAMSDEEFEKQATCALPAKIEACVEDVVEEALSGRKLAVAVKFHDTRNALREKIESKLRKVPDRQRPDLWDIHGGVSADNRLRMADAFVESRRGCIWMGTIESMDVGFSLRGLDTFHFLELVQDPALMFQAEERGYEQGTKGLTIVYWVMKNHADHHVLTSLAPRIEMFARDQGGTSVAGAKEALDVRRKESIDEARERIARGVDFELIGL